MNYLTSLAILLPLALAQDVTVPTTCTGNFSAGTDEVLFTLPYTYTEVMSIIGNYSNLTWSGSPEGSVTLNSTDNEIGTARTYDLAGAHIIETILAYIQPPLPGPYVEVHNTALLSVSGVEVYIPIDATVVFSVCDGAATMMNFTASFCATNVTLAGDLLHQLHLGDAQTVGKFLGGKNFTGCERGVGPASATGALPAGSTPFAPPGNASRTASGDASATATATATATGDATATAMATGGAVRQGLRGLVGGAAVAVLMYSVL